LLLSAITGSPYLELAAISISFAGISSALGPFWAIPNLFLVGTAAAGAIALINSLGNLGGFVGPTLMGYMKQTTGGFAGGLALLALGIAGAAALSMFVPRPGNSCTWAPHAGGHAMLVALFPRRSGPERTLSSSLPCHRLPYATWLAPTTSVNGEQNPFAQESQWQN